MSIDSYPMWSLEERCGLQNTFGGYWHMFEFKAVRLDTVITWAKIGMEEQND